jgi:WD40 repeat protein
MDVEMVKANSYPHVSFHVLNFVCLANQQYSAHADVKENLLAINNLHNGIDLYSIPNMQLIKTYSHSNANNAIFKVSFVDRDWLVSGGHNGFACLYDVQSGQFLQKLEHGSGM